MANSTLTNLFVDIADAIREKSDSSGKIPAVEFPNRIRAISGGGGSDCLPVPDEYQSFVDEAKNLYSGDYAHIAVAESDNILNVAFLMDDFTVLSYDQSSTEYTAVGWLYCEYTKATQTWRVVDYRTEASTGTNYVKHIRYSSAYWMYNGQVIWPVGGGSSGGDGIKQSEVYDMVLVEPSKDMVYTVPRDGTLFVVSNFTYGLTGFETQIEKRQNTLRVRDSDGGFLDAVSAQCVSKKNVVSGENVAIPSTDEYTCLILAEPGSNVVDYSTTVRRFSCADAPVNPVELVSTERIDGFGCFRAVLSNAAHTITAHDGLSKALFFPYASGSVGWSVPGYFTGISNRISIQTPAANYNPNSYMAFAFKLSTEGTPVHDIDPRVMVIEKATTWSFDSGQKRSITSSVNGNMIFVGAYRSSDAFPLGGFTVVKQWTHTINGSTQTMVIAYKAVTVGEVISTSATSDRFGGTIYETNAKFNGISVVNGNATRDGGSIVYPMPEEHYVMFGIAGFVRQGSFVGDANVPDIYTQKEATAGRLTTFYANSFSNASGESNISFPFSDYNEGEEDVQGIWAKFTFAE